MSTVEKFARTTYSAVEYERRLRRLNQLRYILVFVYLVMLMLNLIGTVTALGVPIGVLFKYLTTLIHIGFEFLRKYTSIIVLTTFLLNSIDFLIGLFIVSTMSTIGKRTIGFMKFFETWILPLLNICAFIASGIWSFLVFAFLYWGIYYLDKVRTMYMKAIKQLLEDREIGHLLKSVIRTRAPDFIKELDVPP